SERERAGRKLASGCVDLPAKAQGCMGLTRYYGPLTVASRAFGYGTSYHPSRGERMETVASLSPASRYSKLSVLTTVVLIWFHIQAVAAFWSFSWTNLSVAIALFCIAGGFGISMGYHRLHTHRGFKTYKWFEYFLAICGTLTLEGGPIFWVATHRLHHQHSDQHEDPHSPRVTGFWAHICWIMFGEAHHNDTARMARYAPDLGKDPFYRWLTTYHWVPLTVLGFSLLAIGGWGLVNWAIFLRVVLGLHSTSLAKSATLCWANPAFS